MRKRVVRILAQVLLTYVAIGLLVVLFGWAAQ